jgi:hypothetical protein
MAIELPQIGAPRGLAGRTEEREDRGVRQYGGADRGRKEQFAAGGEAAVPDVDDVSDHFEIFAHDLLLARDLFAVHVGVNCSWIAIAEQIERLVTVREINKLLQYITASSA